MPKFLLFFLCICSLMVSQVTEASHPEQSGYRLAFVANVDGNWDLFTAYADGTNLKRLTDTPYDEADPVWSPDRKHIAYSATDGYVRVVNLATGNVGVIKPPSGDMAYHHPSYSPDGTLMAVSIHYRRSIDKADIGIIDLTDTTLHIPVPQGSLQLFPSWSADGATLYYVVVTCNVQCGRVIQEIWSLPWPNGSPKQALLTNSHCQSPALSPCGERLVFSSDMEDGFDLWMHCYTSGETVRLTYDPAMDIGPSWSNDGASIAFTSTRNGGFSIYLLNVETREIREFEPFGEKAIECKDSDF